MLSLRTATRAWVALAPLLAPAAAVAADLDARTEITSRGTIITPSSSLKLAGQAHTNVKIFVARGRQASVTAPYGNFETPASLACVYGVTKRVDHCNPTTLKTINTAGSRMIAIVDAYDDPNAAKDLAAYSNQYGLPNINAGNFAVVYASGRRPARDLTGGWELEESLDIEMAHALAPNATIVLVEAKSSYFTDLFNAEKVAIKLVEAAGGGEVSNSWEGSESPTEAQDEAIFQGQNVTVFASAGDAPGTGEPAALPNVIGVGGTSVNRTANGDLINETSWYETGGGLSRYIGTPAFQSAVTSVVGTARGVPDIAAVADPQTGVWVYDSTPYEGANGTLVGWIVLGGTSVASPVAAAIVNDAGTFNASTTDELTEIYTNLGNTKAFTDITKGPCGNNLLGHVTIGYDVCTGIGVPVSGVGK